MEQHWKNTTHVNIQHVEDEGQGLYKKVHRNSSSYGKIELYLNLFQPNTEYRMIRVYIKYDTGNT